MKDNSYAFILDCSLDKKGNIIIYELQPLVDSGIGEKCADTQNAFQKAFPNQSIYIANYFSVDVKNNDGGIFVKKCDEIKDKDKEFYQDYAYKFTPSGYERFQLDNKVNQRVYLPKEVSPEHLTLDLSISSNKLADQIVQYFKDKDITKIVLKHPDSAVGEGNIFINDLSDKNKIEDGIEQLKKRRGMHIRLTPKYLLAEEQKIFSRISRKTEKQKNGYLTFRIVGIATQEGSLGYFIATKSLSEEVNSHKRIRMKGAFGEKSETISYDYHNKWTTIYIGPKDKYFNIGKRKIPIDSIQEVFKSAYHLYHDIKSNTKEKFEAHIAKLAKSNNHEIAFIDSKFQKSELVEKNDFVALLNASNAQYLPLIDKILKEINYEPSDLADISNVLNNTDNPVLKAVLCIIGIQKDPIKKYDIENFIMEEYYKHYNITIEEIVTIAAKEGYLNFIKHYAGNKNINENPEIRKMLAKVLVIAAKERGKILEFLIENKINVDSKDEYNTTPLISALLNGDIKAAKLLIENGANVNAENDYVQRPLILAAYNGHIEVVKLLIEKGADVNVIDYGGNTPLILAAYNGHIEIVKMLIVAGAMVNIQSKDGVTALMLAAQNGHTATVKLLLEHGANISLKSNVRDNTALHFAIEGNHVEATRALLYTEINVLHVFGTNEKNKDGNTPLHIAIKNAISNNYNDEEKTNNGMIIKLLLQRGADIHITDANRKTFLDLVKYSQVYIPLLELVAKYIPKDVKDFLLNEPDLVKKLNEENKLGKELKEIVDDLKNVQDNLQKENDMATLLISNVIRVDLREKSRS